MSKLDALIKELSNLTIIDAAKLVKMLEKKWDIKDIYTNAAMPTSLKKETDSIKKSKFLIKLVTIGQKKIQIIKTIRELTGLGLKESKNLVDSCPKTIKSNIEEKEAKEIKEKLEAQGATIQII